jgi:hypothetical protein
MVGTGDHDVKEISQTQKEKFLMFYLMLKEFLKYLKSMEVEGRLFEREKNEWEVGEGRRK